ncbi:hypothetical protein M569_12583, partial [Genlisea aurea]
GDASPGMGMFTPVPPHAPSPSQISYPNPNISTAQHPPESAGNMTMWTSHRPNFHGSSVAPIMPITACPPGIPSSMGSSNSTIDSTARLRGYAPNASAVCVPTMPHLAAIHGQWLQPQVAANFSRPAFPSHGDVVPAPNTVPFNNRPPLVSLPDVQPPGVSPAASVGGPSSIIIDQVNTNGNKRVYTGEIKDEAPKKMDAWTMHRSEAGVIYYYNALTGKSTYEKPPDFNGEDKGTMQSAPVSWEKLADTDWMLVNMNDGRRYYYNNITKLSSWQVPPEVADMRKKQDSQGSDSRSVALSSGDAVTEKVSDVSSLNTPATITGGRDAVPVRSPAVSSGSSSALDLIKRKLQDPGIPDSTSPGSSLPAAVEINGRKSADATIKSLQNESGKEKNKDGDGDADVSNSSSDSEDEDVDPMKEECVLKFKEMLKERGVAPFSKWEKELPKIVFDPRFKAIKDHTARRTLFEHYVRTRAEEERKEKRAALKAALEGFKQLLEEKKEDIDHNTDYQTFRTKWGEDPRFKALDRKEKELLLNERVLPLKKAAEEMAHAARLAAVSDFKSMLQDKGRVTSSSRWSKVKDSLKGDPRYRAIRHEDRERLFNEFVDELKAAEDAARKAKPPVDDQEDKLKQRERALLKRKEREEQEVERVRQKARRKEAVESYQALLVETIKDPQVS